MTRYNDLTYGGSKPSAYGSSSVSRPTPGLSMTGKGPLLPGNYPEGANKISIARAKGRASSAARLAAHRLAVKNAKMQSNPKFLAAKSVKPLPGIANLPPKYSG